VRYGWDEVAEDHHVTVTSLPEWLVEQLGVDATRGMGRRDWLATPQQRLLGVVAGPVHADDDGALTRVRADLAWYPDPIWRWLLACQWRRLAQEEAFVQRAAEAGDELGSAVVAARLVRDVMRLALLLERRTRRTRSGWAPRSPGSVTRTAWLGTSRRPSTPLASRSARRPSARPTWRSPAVTTARASRSRSTRPCARTTAVRRRCSWQTASPKPAWPRWTTRSSGRSR
jgi:hypothetical protein